MALLRPCIAAPKRLSTKESDEMVLHAFSAKRTTVVTTLQADIKNTIEKFPNFEIRSLDSLTDYNNICQIASDRLRWKRITKAIFDSVKAN